MIFLYFWAGNNHRHFLLIQYNTMKQLFAFAALILLFASQASAQKVYETDNKYNADVICYQTDNKYNADLIVYITDNKYNADGNEGIWYYTDNKYNADKQVFFTDNKYNAKLIIYVTDNKYNAGWEESSKKHLMR